MRSNASITADLHPFASSPSPVSALRVTCAALPDGGASFVFTLEGQMAALRVPVRDDESNAWPLWQHTCFEAFLSAPDEDGYREYNFSPAGLWAAMAFRRYREMERELKGDDVPPPVIEAKVKEPLNNSPRVGAPGFGMGCTGCTSAAIPGGIASICNEADRPNTGCGRREGVVQRFLKRDQPFPLSRLRERGRGEGASSVHSVCSRGSAAGPLPSPLPQAGEGVFFSSSPRGQEPETTALHLTAHLPRALIPAGPVLRIGLSAVIERADGQLEYWALHHPRADRADFHHPDGWTLRLNTLIERTQA